MRNDMISIIFPTRNRPQNLLSLFRSLKDTSDVMPEIIVYIDDDDSVSVNVASELAIKYVQGPRNLLSQSYNKAAELATSNMLMYAADDLLFRTPSWDSLVITAFDESKDKILLVHGDDMHDGGTRCATHGILHRRWIETLGYFLPPYFGAWADDWITRIGNALNRRVCLPFINEHMNYRIGKSAYDSTYKEAELKQSGDNVLYKKLAPKIAVDIEKLRLVMHN
jgi:glycosyltransferase involved in cell wall biosynthesis